MEVIDVNFLNKTSSFLIVSSEIRSFSYEDNISKNGFLPFKAHNSAFWGVLGPKI